MPRKNFARPDRYSILIPYKDFEKIVKMAEEIEDMQYRYRRMEEMYLAMQEMYREALDKIADINRYL